MFDDLDVKLVMSLINWAWESGGVSGKGAKERAQAIWMLESKCRAWMEARAPHPPHEAPEKPNGTDRKPAAGSILTEEPTPVEAV